MRGRYAWLALAAPLSCSGVIGIGDLPRSTSGIGGTEDGPIEDSSDLPEADAETPKTCATTQQSGSPHAYCADFEDGLQTLWVGATKRMSGLTPLGRTLPTVVPNEGGNELLAVVELTGSGDIDRSTLRTPIELAREDAFDIGWTSSVGKFGFVVLSVNFALKVGGEMTLSVWVKSTGVGLFTDSPVQPEAAEFPTSTLGKRVALHLKRERKRLTVLVAGTERGSTTFESLPVASDVRTVSIQIGGVGLRAGALPAAGTHETRFDNLTID